MGSIVSNPVMRVYTRNELMTENVKNGNLNRDEFTNLAQYQNETERLRATFNKDGKIDIFEKMQLESRDKTWGNMFQQYKAGDYHPYTQANDSIQQRQVSQLGRIWGGLAGGSITNGEGNYLLNEQQSIARQRGAGEPLLRVFGAPEPVRNDVHRSLDRSSWDIFAAKHNWTNDWTQGMRFPIPFFGYGY